MSAPILPNQSLTICVIFNPAAGRKRARQRFEAISASWRGRAELWPTERPGHAVELARRAAESGFAIVAAAEGDGTVHEVANGILQAARTDVCFAVLPLGSADDYAHSLKYEQIGRSNGSSVGRLVDVGRVRTDRGAERFFVGCMGLGFGPRVTLESQRLGWLQGRFLYGVAGLRAMWNRWEFLNLTATLDDQPLTVGRTLMISVMLGRREGGFVMAPDALLDDGWFDVLHVAELTRWNALCLIPSLSTTGPPRDYPGLSFLRGRQLHVESRQPLVIHTDGEMLCRPEDKVYGIDVELIPRRLLVCLGLDHIDGGDRNEHRPESAFFGGHFAP